MNNNTYNKKGGGARGLAGTVLAILILLTLISGILLTVRLLDYITKDDKAVMMQSGLDTKLELFSVEYENESGEITVRGAEGQEVIAPGTSVDYTIRLSNKDKVALDYSLVPDISFTSKYDIPIVFRMIDEDGNYIIGDAKTWASADDAKALFETGTILKGQSVEYVFQWQWLFESGNDEYDTLLGTMSDIENIGVSVSFELAAAANLDIDLNGGFAESGLEYITVIAIMLALLIAAVILMIIYMVKKRRRESV